MNALPSASATLHATLSVCIAAIFLAGDVFAQPAPCGVNPPCPVYLRQSTVVPPEPASPSWIFNRSTYSHDPATGARVAQYEPLPSVEPLQDERLVTSRYHQTRTNLRGANGSSETIYDVQSWGNGRGGLDAEWERVHDAWKESYLSGSYYNQAGGSYGQGPWNAGPYGGPGWGGPVYGGGFGNGGGYGYPGYGFPGYGYPAGPGGWNGPNNGPGNGGGWQNGGPQQGGGNHYHDD